MPRSILDDELAELKKMLVDEASASVSMLEAALPALFNRDIAAAKGVRKRDDHIDALEIAIESRCFSAMTLQQPVARDFRFIAFVLKVNGDIERIADHACSVAKMAVALADQPPFDWPTALTELGQRVPAMCHRMLRAMIDEDEAAARAVLLGDKTIDALNKQLFEDAITLMETLPDFHRAGTHLVRTGRELERIGDLASNIAEDVVYLATGNIIRHEAKLNKNT